MKPFADLVVVVTGASDGIGAEMAKQLAEQGAWLSLAARRAHELDLTAQECIAHGARAIVCPTDVTDPAQCEALVKHTLESYGKIDVLVNNAGIGAHFAFADVTDLRVFEQVMRVNYLGSVYCTHFALPALLKSRGRIVAVSSLTGKTGVPQRSAYAASKHAMQGFFDSLRIELLDTGISVTVISPGFVRTEIRARALRGDGAPLGADPIAREHSMTVVECATASIAAIQHRKRELVMTKAWPLKAMLKVVAPRLIDDIARKTIEQNGAPE